MTGQFDAIFLALVFVDTILFFALVWLLFRTRQRQEEVT